MKRTIVQVVNREPEQQHWYIQVRLDDGSLFGHVLPHITWAARAAEYGIKNYQIDDLIDLCLHEQLTKIHHDHPDFVYNTDEVTALKALRQRVAEAKKLETFEDPDNLLQIIRDHHKQNPQNEFYDKHRGVVADYRRRRMVALAQGRQE